jgi:hypothetical protein
MTLLSDAPEFVHEFAERHVPKHETPVGFFADTKPDPADPDHRVVVAHWVVVTSGGLYFLHPESQLCLRAKSVHSLRATP